MSELWLTRAPSKPVAIVGSEQTLLYNDSHEQGWAVVRQPIPAAEILITDGDLRSLFGALMQAMGYRLSELGVALPESLMPAITAAPAAAVGFGEGAVLPIKRPPALREQMAFRQLLRDGHPVRRVLGRAARAAAARPGPRRHRGLPPHHLVTACRTRPAAVREASFCRR
jgi:hypothetical protein